MKKITIENVKASRKLNDTEKIVMEHMLIWEERHPEDAFILPDESGLVELGIRNVFAACRHFVELGVLQVRDCEAIAYEWNNKNNLLDLI
jgi:hypothetical protein